MSSDKTKKNGKSGHKEIKVDDFPSHKHYPKGKAGDPHCYDFLDHEELKLRGKTYLKDKVKVKAGEPILRLVNCDLFYSKEHLDDWSSHPESYISRLNNKGDKRFKFCLVFQFPPQHMAATWVLDEKSSDDDSEEDNETKLYNLLKEKDHAFATLWKNWLAGDKTYRDERLKILPRVVAGGFIIRTALMTGKPAILGTKMTCKYTNKINTEANYFHIDCDVYSSDIAKKVIGMIKKYTKDLAFDVAFILEAKENSELPERIFAGLDYSRVNVAKGRVIDGIEPGDYKD
eukprot:TRINITY_DN5695_c0_g1_i1.p1 TRINITY_DN5695_c0_g1~~TRINITY_DN5695_c0_g1_i1.p1  ORF type:complete len:309 (-),score=54.30 TRINITY_DN5695_c0_g1_i1:114-977(-)